MKKYFLDYLKWLDQKLADSSTDLRVLLKIHREKTRYFQHERFVHLFVMILFAICTVATFLVIVVTEKFQLLPLEALFLVLLVPYISHYYFLENNTQKLYRYYDEIVERISSSEVSENAEQ